MSRAVLPPTHGASRWPEAARARRGLGVIAVVVALHAFLLASLRFDPAPSGSGLASPVAAARMVLVPPRDLMLRHAGATSAPAQADAEAKVATPTLAAPPSPPVREPRAVRAPVKRANASTRVQPAIGAERSEAAPSAAIVDPAAAAPGPDDTPFRVRTPTPGPKENEPSAADAAAEFDPIGDVISSTAAAETAAPPTPLLAEALRELPVYESKLPPSRSMRFKVTRGERQGDAWLEWLQGDGRYQAALRVQGEGLPATHWTSDGAAMPGQGASPERMVAHRRGRPVDAANFDPRGGRITFSGPRIEQPFAMGGQDRLSWMMQLAGVLNAQPGRWRAGEAIVLYVVGPRGAAELWRFVIAGIEPVEDAAGAVVAALKLTREAVRPFDVDVELWLDPSDHHLPVRWRQQQRGTTRPALEWVRVTP